MALDIKTLPTIEVPLHVPEPEDITRVLSLGLKANFEEVSVEFVDCPDFTKDPFYLACPGISGKAKILDVGGVPNMLPLVDRSKVYDLKEICDVRGMDSAFLIGAGGGPWPLLGTNCEGVFNMSVINKQLNQQSRYASVFPKDAEKGESVCKLEKYPENETRGAVLVNLLLTEGKPGKALRIECKKRIGTESYTSAIRQCLALEYKEKSVGLGGTFLLKEGKSRQHIMPDFSTVPLNSDRNVEDWLHFYNMSAPLINVGTLISFDPGLDLRLHHFHTFSQHGEGGHYHYDTTPETAHYIGYFAVAETLIRIDQPLLSLNFGQD